MECALLTHSSPTNASTRPRGKPLPNPSAEPSLKDYVLVQHRLRPSVLDTRVCKGADIDSDHRLVVLSIRLNLQRKVHRRQQKSFDAQLCKEEDHRREYMEEIRTQFDNRK